MRSDLNMRPGSDSRQQRRWRRASVLLLAGLAVLGVVSRDGLWHAEPEDVPASTAFFVAGPLPGLHPTRPLARTAMRAEAAEDSDEESEEESEEEESDDDQYGIASEFNMSPEELKEARNKEYKYDEEPSQLWWKLQKVDTKAVLTRVGKEFLKPLSWFPNPGVKIGDVIRVSFLNIDATTYERGDDILYEGTVIDIYGHRHKRIFHCRSIMGGGNCRLGQEVKFPVHSPHITSMQVLRYNLCEYKNALFLRANFVKPWVKGRVRSNIKQAINLQEDKERVALAKAYNELREVGKTDAIPPLRFYP